jgi:hypothetical protein
MTGDVMIKYLASFCIMLSMLFFSQSVSAQETMGGTANPFAQAKFVPDISLVMDASYTQRNYRDEAFRKLLIPGFSHVNADNSVYQQKGFNFNYAELVVSSVVDPFFDLFVVCEFGGRTVDIEEAYFSTRRLPWGLQVKGGKFLSHFGRLNSQHTHQWDFAEAPLIYEVFFGESLLNEKGLRLTWVAPMDTYLMLGGEITQGDNQMSFGRSGFADPSGSFIVRESDGPNLGVAYAKTSFDVNNFTFLMGVSNAAGMTRINQGLEYGEPLSQADYGRTNIAGMDLTIKYLIDSIRYLSFQGEYLLRTSTGDHYQMGPDGVEKKKFDNRQDGFYGQLIGRFSKRLRLGVRYDLINHNDVEFDHSAQIYPERMPRLSAMAEYNPTEFSRLRLQYNHDPATKWVQADCHKKPTVNWFCRSISPSALTAPMRFNTEKEISHEKDLYDYSFVVSGVAALGGAPACGGHLSLHRRIG